MGRSAHTPLSSQIVWLENWVQELEQLLNVERDRLERNAELIAENQWLRDVLEVAVWAISNKRFWNDWYKDTATTVGSLINLAALKEERDGK